MYKVIAYYNDVRMVFWGKSPKIALTQAAEWMRGLGLNELYGCEKYGMILKNSRNQEMGHKRVFPYMTSHYGMNSVNKLMDEISFFTGKPTNFHCPEIWQSPIFY